MQANETHTYDNLFHVIVGYGYSGSYLAEALKQSSHPIATIRRHHSDVPAHCHAFSVDITTESLPAIRIDTLYYLVPPPKNGYQDTTLKAFLANLRYLPRKIVYFGSSGLYGDHQGAWVDETSPLYLQYNRHYQKRDAEKQLTSFCQKNGIDLTLLRISGIYGPNRLPIDKLRQKKPIIKTAQAPYTNAVCVYDLVWFAIKLGEKTQSIECYNISDHTPRKMGALQCKLADLLGFPPPPEIDFSSYYHTASQMAQTFITSSKKLDASKAIQALNGAYRPYELKEGLKASLNEMNYSC
jgi:nucleoside-diphosphate-sugar epimerase